MSPTVQAFVASSASIAGMTRIALWVSPVTSKLATPGIGHFCGVLGILCAERHLESLQGTPDWSLEHGPLRCLERARYSSCYDTSQNP